MTEVDLDRLQLKHNIEHQLFRGGIDGLADMVEKARADGYVAGTAEGPPQRYTLDEARQLLAEKQCDEEGHDLDQVAINRGDGPRTWHIACLRCTTIFVPKEAA